jgi:Peptidase inhibitor I78 family
MTDIRKLGLGLGCGVVLALGACAQGGNDKSGAPAEELGTCAAADHQDWVGQRVDVLNDVDLPEGTRVLFPTTPATTDHREERTNVSVDKNDVITRVFCG